MDNRDIIEKVLTEKDSFQIKSSSELIEILDDELSKPDADYKIVDELATAVIESQGKERLTADIDAELNKLLERKSRRNRKIRFQKRIIGLSAVCVILFCANCISVSAWDMNIFSAVIEFTRGGFSVDFNKTEIIELLILTLFRSQQSQFRSYRPSLPASTASRQISHRKSFRF